MQLLLYENKQVRMFSDIDLWILGISFDDFYHLLSKSNFDVTGYKIIGHKDIEIKLNVIYKDVKFTIEVKQKNHHSAIYTKNKHLELQLTDCVVKTFSIEDTFLILMNYFYYYTEDINSIIFDGKTIFQLPHDIYNLVKKYDKQMDWNYILQMAIQTKAIHKIRIGFIKLAKIFDSNFNKYLQMFPLEAIKYNDSEIIDVGRINWDVPLISRFIDKKEINQFMIKYRMGDFLIGLGNKNIFNYIFDTFVINQNKYQYFIRLKSDYIELKVISSDNFDKNMLLYLNIYAYRLDGFFHNPFMPITILKEQDIQVFDKFVIVRDDQMKFNREAANKLPKNNQNIQVNQIDKTLVVKIHLTPYELDVTRNIGVNFYVYTLNLDEHIVEHYRLVPNYSLPYILKEVKEDE